jgi:hypothetical protein
MLSGNLGFKVQSNHGHMQWELLGRNRGKIYRYNFFFKNHKTLLVLDLEN